jgi:DNA-binding beta-propeller fold protein YncE/mono/diheme cytochrome c family protein
LVLLPGERALTANHTADTVSLVDLKEGKVLAEQRCGRKPVAVACSRDGRRAAVSNLWSRSVTLLEVQDRGLQVHGTVEVGALPRGLVFAPDGNVLYATVAGDDEVVQLDWRTRQVKQRWSAPREPRDLALSADGRCLAAASSRSAQVRCWDTASGKLHWERTIIDGFNLRGLTFTPDGKDLVCAHALRREFPVSKHHIDQGWVIDNRLSKLSLAADARPDYWQIALDVRGQAVADPHGLAFSADGRRLVVAASGTHELVILEPTFMPWSPGEPGDFIDVSLEIGVHKLRRVEVGGRPLTLALTDGGRTAIVANYLLDAVQVVDVEAGKLARSIALGGPEKPSLERQGEAIFYDALRSHHQWFSCHTCHTDGHTCCLKFDTLNDDSYGNPKLTPTLHNVTRTGPWTWHGWQKDLGMSIEKSLTETMFGPKPTAADVQALLAYFATLKPAPNPHRQPDGSFSAAAQRGQVLFNGKARCARCHKGGLYTSESNYDVKLESDGSPYDLWNPPSLLGLWDRGPYLHDGRAETLQGLLEKHHSAEKLGGTALAEQERRDLLAFLKSL